MNTKDLSSLLIKIAGIVIIIFTVTGIPGAISYYSVFIEQSGVSYVAYVIMPNIIPLLAGIWMFLVPEKITAKIITIKKPESVTTSQETKGLCEIEIIAITMLGFYLLFSATSDMVYNLYEWYQLKGKMSLLSGQVSYIELYSRIIATIAELIFSAWLILGSKGIIKILHQFRNIENK